ncbi:MAG: sulfite exporter TauE/SafE family protein [Planctomycetaceae bacterium]|nr:sulfite exporter TauE/SafE family protein [Planctomycetaceae bacterium]
MWTLWGTVFIASLVGSLHCVGMCGPFALLAGASGESRGSSILPSVVYSLGRLMTYSIVGLVFGAFGMALNNGVSFASWQQGATYAAGGLMISVGLISLARYLGVSIRLPGRLLPIAKLLQAGFARTQSLPRLQRAFSIGALTSLMPCGWLYTFAIAAAGTGSPTQGLIVMVVFWAGTVPIMVALMLGVDRIGFSVRSRLPVVMASLVIAIGVFTLARRAPVRLGEFVPVSGGTELVIEQVQNIDHQALPCCQSSEGADQ